MSTQHLQDTRGNSYPWSPASFRLWARYRAREAYAALIRQMQSRGYRVQTHQLVFIVDEREAHTTLLQRIFGLVDIRGDREVLMLYTNFARRVGAALIWQYGPVAQTIAVGSTASSGDPGRTPRIPPELGKILPRPDCGPSLLAGDWRVQPGRRVRQGFMPKLKAMDWTQAVAIPAESLKGSVQFSKGVRAILWLGSHLVYFIAVFLVMVAWLVRVISASAETEGIYRTSGVLVFQLSDKPT